VAAGTFQEKNLSMSATTFGAETLSLEGADPCQILVLYEDAVTHDVAMEVCRRLLARFEAELAFAFSFCKFQRLGPISYRPLGGGSHGPRGRPVIFPAGS